MSLARVPFHPCIFGRYLPRFADKTPPLAASAVNTYLDNSSKNGAPLANPANENTLEDLYDEKMNTPGFIRLPVCDPAMAYAAWTQQDGPSVAVPNYPCIGPQLIGYCDTSSFEGDTTNGSPLVSDCELLVKDLLDRAPTDRVKHTVAVNFQSSIEQHGTCVFGVYGKGEGNADYRVGGQDMVDIITDAIRQFSWNGKVGAHGSMNCKGTIKDQWVTWGLYHSE